MIGYAFLGAIVGAIVGAILGVIFYCFIYFFFVFLFGMSTSSIGLDALGLDAFARLGSLIFAFGFAIQFPIEFRKDDNKPKTDKPKTGFFSTGIFKDGRPDAPQAVSKEAE